MGCDDVHTCRSRGRGAMLTMVDVDGTIQRRKERERKEMGSEAKLEREKMQEERIRTGALAKDRT